MKGTKNEVRNDTTRWRIKFAGSKKEQTPEGIRGQDIVEFGTVRAGGTDGGWIA